MGALAILLIAAVIWGVTQSGTGGGDFPAFDMPASPAGPTAGYTCLPASTCADADQDAKWMSQVGSAEASFGGAPIVAWVAIPNSQSSFTLDIFDGDTGRTDAGTISHRGGNWDTGYDSNPPESEYTLFLDPQQDGTGMTVVGSWRGNQDSMPNNDWFSISQNTDTAALSASREYFIYRIEAKLIDVDAPGINRFKLRSSGFLSMGRAQIIVDGSTPYGVVDASISIVGGGAQRTDIPIWYPEFSGDYNNPGPSTYDGDWQFYIYVPNNVNSLTIWDGDFDYGSSDRSALDADDLNTEGKPPWAISATDESAKDVGAPADNFFHPLYQRGDSVSYEIIGPDGAVIHNNTDPSGTEEWEQFTLGTADTNPDFEVPALSPGLYILHIEGLDAFNTVWIRSQYGFCSDPDGCIPTFTEGSCPRTIGYWKNNVSKIMDNKPRGVQESPESLTHALGAVASQSELYRNGLNVTNPASISSPTSLTFAEANDILQKTNGNSMLDRALQQNMATWLNLASGKLGPTTVVSLDVAGGTFNGTVIEALLEAQKIILNNQTDDALLERAKDIADQINNGLLGEDAETSSCSDYEEVMPPDLQPPDREDMPESPPQPDLPDPTPIPPQTGDECTDRMDGFDIENPATNPFYGIKFNYTSGDEIKDGLTDEFRIVLTAEEVAALSASGMQVEVKASTNSQTVTLSCDFSNGSCGDPVTSEDGSYDVYFIGSTDNGDGTFTLTLWVQNHSNHGISQVTFGLPDGTTAGVCQP
jgi:hypothetical protein